MNGDFLKDTSVYHRNTMDIWNNNILIEITWVYNKEVSWNHPKKFCSRKKGLLWKTIFSISVLHDCWHLFKVFALPSNNYSTKNDKINSLNLAKFQNCENLRTGCSLIYTSANLLLLRLNFPKFSITSELIIYRKILEFLLLSKVKSYAVILPAYSCWKIQRNVDKLGGREGPIKRWLYQGKFKRREGWFEFVPIGLTLAEGKFPKCE